MELQFYTKSVSVCLSDTQLVPETTAQTILRTSAASPDAQPKQSPTATDSFRKRVRKKQAVWNPFVEPLTVVKGLPRVDCLVRGDI